MANRNYISQKFFSWHAMPVNLDCIFTVAATDTAGYGITGLKGGGVQNVYMHTSATPATGNPNPASGYIYLKLQDPFVYLYDIRAAFHPPVTGGSINIKDSSSLTVGTAYQIVTLGNSTAADWATVGLPAGQTAAVGMSFIATATSAGGSHTGTVKLIGTSGVSHVELVGSPTLTLNPSNPAQNGGGLILLQCLGASAAAPALTMNSYTPAGTNNSATPPIFSGTPAVLTGTVAAPALSYGLVAPTAGTVIRISMLLSNSSVLVNGD